MNGSNTVSGVFLSIVVICLGCVSPKTATVTKNQLNGTWVPISQEIGGTALPKPAFEKQKLVINDTTYTVIAESVDKGSVNVKGDKMDILGKEGVNAGKHFTALYKLAGEQLTVCYDLSGKDYPRTFDTKGKVMYFLAVFHKDASQ